MSTIIVDYVTYSLESGHLIELKDHLAGFLCFNVAHSDDAVMVLAA